MSLRLDRRLAAAAELCLPGLPVADIGCDHGRLTAFLAQSGRFPKVIGADLNPAPLARAAETLRRCHCEQAAELRLGDGLSVLAPGEAGTIVIAGLSAKTTIDMLAAAPWTLASGGPRLVLVPATKHAVLRGFLAESGCAFLCDRPVRCAGHWYAVMAAQPGAQPRQPSLAECLYGGTGAWPEGPAYAALQRGKLQKYRRGLPDNAPLAAAIDALLDEAAAAGLACRL